MTNSTKTPVLTIPLGREAHTLAMYWAAQQITPQTGKQIYLNALAVYAVHSYLQWLHIETDLNDCDLSVLSGTNLLLPQMRRLGCCAVLPGETHIRLSPQTGNVPTRGTASHPIGNIAVQFSETLHAVELLGFTPIVATDRAISLQIADLQPLEALLEVLPDFSEQSATVIPGWVNLSRWLEHSIDAGWQTLEDLFNPQSANPVFSARTGRNDETNRSTGRISRGKVLNLAMQFEGNPIALIVSLQPSPTASELDILLRLCPTGSQIYLPQHLHLAVLNEAGEICLETIARSADNWIQLAFNGEPGERFTVQVTLGENSITENFII